MIEEEAPKRIWIENADLRGVASLEDLAEQSNYAQTEYIRADVLQMIRERIKAEAACSPPMGEARAILLCLQIIDEECRP